MSHFQFPAVLTTGAMRSTITAFNPLAENPVYMADSFHPHWQAILDGLESGDHNVWSLFDVGTGIAARFNKITDRISYDGKNILLDGNAMHTALAEHLARVIEAGSSEDDIRATALFYEKLESNPNAHSREQAFSWLAAHKFQITLDGDIVGFKGVREIGNGVWESMYGSNVPGKPSAYVNGNPIPERSKVPQSIGDEVTMPRDEVEHDPSKACSRGLHVATKSYAASYGTVMTVYVNPRDIVSVPEDASGEKVRACRYYIAGIAGDNSDTSPVLRTESQSSHWVGNVGYKV